eukprot:TRINITY_DN25936_c0_g1_i2.p1 TRINITY_DN25936_c0_g1~~TRINITY_DN25936_c0_g1_i2.p1  ORF type:complete len:419 (-),score=122.42 TRINITY_DN25936_c0_g1_i2:12-1268(-)
MGMFSKKPSKLHQANTQLQAESNKLSELSEAVEGLKERLKTQQENQRRLAAQKNNLKDAFGRLQTARTKLRPQLNELQEELQSCAGRKAAFEQQCAGDVRESQRAREWLDRLRQASIMLTSAQQRRRAEEVAAPATVAATSESPPVAATDASACAAAEGQGHLQALPAEAMRLAQQQHDELSKRIQQTAAKTVALDEEREALSGERAQLLDEQRALKADTAALVEAKADAAERLEQAHAEVAALRGRYEAMKLELETAQRDADSLSRRHEAVVADLESLRGRRTDLRNAAFSEITEGAGASDGGPADPPEGACGSCECSLPAHRSRGRRPDARAARRWWHVGPHLLRFEERAAEGLTGASACCAAAELRACRATHLLANSAERFAVCRPSVAAGPCCQHNRLILKPRPTSWCVLCVQN